MVVFFGFINIEILANHSHVCDQCMSMFQKTKQYMKKNYRLFYTPSGPKEKDLPISEYIRFIKFWDILIFVADILLMVETLEIVFYIDVSFV